MSCPTSSTSASLDISLGGEITDMMSSSHLQHPLWGSATLSFCELRENAVERGVTILGLPEAKIAMRAGPKRAWLLIDGEL